MLCLKDFEEYAKKHLDQKAWCFFSQGAERDFTFKENLRSFTRYAFIPRMLRNTGQRDLSTTVLGRKVSMPIGIAPMACQKLAHPDGEIASSRAASKSGLVFALSTFSNTTLEDIKTNIPNDTPLWMQVYVFRNREATKDLILKAENNGYTALVLTVDSPVLGLRLKSLRIGGIHLPPHISAPNFQSIAAVGDARQNSSVNKYIDDTLTWDDVTWIKSFSKLPIILKGILTAEDALQAVKYGAAAVWISNHGGRQLDGTLTALEVLSEISSALSGTNCKVYADGGVRWGSDVLKFLALGAKAVFVGRPVLWGLVHSGEEGVQSVLNILKSELDRAMHLVGCNNISEVGPHIVKKRNYAKL